MQLDLSSLRKAVESLERALRVADDEAFTSGLNEEQRETVRAGVRVSSSLMNCAGSL